LQIKSLTHAYVIGTERMNAAIQHIDIALH